MNGIIVVFNGLLDLIGRVFGVLKTPGFGVTLSASGFMVRFGVMGGVMRGVMGGGVMRSRVMRSGVMGERMVGNWGIGVVVWHWGIGVSWGIGVRVIRGGAVRNWGVAIGGGGRSVSIAMGVDRGVWGGS